MEGVTVGMLCCPHMFFVPNSTSTGTKIKQKEFKSKGSTHYYLNNIFI